MRAVFGTACLMEVNSVVFNNSDDNQDNGNCVTHILSPSNIKALRGKFLLVLVLAVFLLSLNVRPERG